MRELKRKGFTLLELLVVISIIGILVALGAVAFSTAQQKGRDAKRRGDMKSIQNAFEQYYAQNASSYNVTCGTMWTGTQSVGSLPTDPKGGTYVYTSNCTASTYYYCAHLEEVGRGNFTDSTATTAGAGDYFCVKNLQ